MSKSKSLTANSGTTTRERILDVAELLLADGAAEFSMRELAAKAGVSFATPFNQFGSKAAIMHALSARLIEVMRDRLACATSVGDAPDRVLRALEIAAGVMLERPAVNRAIMAALGTPSPEPGDVWNNSRALWATALGDGEGLSPGTLRLAQHVLPDQLAFSFRGLLSFWAAGEIANDDLIFRARTLGMSAMFGFVSSARRKALTATLRQSDEI
jgi:AcrR family transcriptional regulator